MIRRVLIGLSVLAGVVYFALQPWQPFPGSAVLKGLTMAPLAALSFVLSRTYGRTLAYLGVAQVFSCAGDVLLDLDPNFFTFGLAAFLLSHVEYASVWLLYRPRPFRSTPVRTAIAAAVVLYALGFALWLAPALGALSAPVALYMAAITTMVVAATLSRFPLSGVALGAILFLVSDSLLAVNKFKFYVPGRDFLVWGTYCAGQLLMALTVVRCLTRQTVPHDKLPAGDSNGRHHSTQSA